MSEAYEILKQQTTERAQAESSLNGRTPPIDEADQPIFERLSLSELFNRPGQKWLIDGLIGEQNLSMVFGDPATGKSFRLMLRTSAGN